MAAPAGMQTPQVVAEKMAPYMITYPSTSNNQKSFIKTFTQVLGGMAAQKKAPTPLRTEHLTMPNIQMTIGWFLQSP